MSEKEGTGLYPELAALGIREGSTANLQEKVARTVVLSPSFALAQEELKQQGIQLNT